MTKKLFETSLLTILLASYANAWDMGSYVENGQTGEGKTDSVFVQQSEQKIPEAAAVDSSMGFNAKKAKQIKAEIKANLKARLQTDEFYHVRRGFYFSTNLSLNYTTSEDFVTDWDDKVALKCSGISLYNEFRLGGHITNLVSVYGALGIGLGKADYEDPNARDSDERKMDAVILKGLLGVGAEIHPFQDKENALYGLYFGLGVGYDIIKVQDYDDGLIYTSQKNDLHDFSSVFIRPEIGYDWWFNPRWRFGVAFNYSYGKIDDDWETNTNHSFNFTIRIAR